MILAVVADLLAVLVFAAIGRASHREDVLLGLVTTAWPFAVGVVVGHLVASALGRRGPDPYTAPTGLVFGGRVWMCVLVLGMVLRAVSGRGVEMSFVVVAAVSLAVLLLGWRAAAAGARRLRPARSRATG